MLSDAAYEPSAVDLYGATWDSFVNFVDFIGCVPCCQYAVGYECWPDAVR